MFPSMTDSRQNKRSLRALVRGAMDTALEFVTLGEATPAGAHRTPPPPPPPDTRTAGNSIIVVSGAVQGWSRRAPRSAPRRFIARPAAPDPRARRRSALGGLIDPAGPRRPLHRLSSRGSTARLEFFQRARPPRSCSFTLLPFARNPHPRPKSGGRARFEGSPSAR